ncbi:MAG: hypothetical protein CO141_00655 [Candidatus Moranbacteria bacterium CG_4_9_14_3_um_filter_42_9]|nr:MAG: hypothetical protein CO141_00655 [Candidatus Moranbacteria bacterium CG_4_9_14_3_um_filter_42_9]
MVKSATEPSVVLPTIVESKKIIFELPSGDFTVILFSSLEIIFPATKSPPPALRLKPVFPARPGFYPGPAGPRRFPELFPPRSIPALV